jgi:hypothetical protein
MYAGKQRLQLCVLCELAHHRSGCPGWLGELCRWYWDCLPPPLYSTASILIFDACFKLTTRVGGFASQLQYVQQLFCMYSRGQAAWLVTIKWKQRYLQMDKMGLVPTQDFLHILSLFLFPIVALSCPSLFGFVPNSLSYYCPAKEVFTWNKQVDAFGLFFMYFIQHCFFCRPSGSSVLEDAWIESRTVM